MKYLLVVWLVIKFAVVQPQEVGTFTDIRDMHVYKWVKMGNQTWMAENLGYLPEVNWVDDSRFEGKCYYVYGYDGTILSEAKSNANYEKYGVLYNWEAACESCPDGWHLSTDRDWAELEEHLGMVPNESGIREWRDSGDVGKKLKSTLGWETGNGTGEAGFNALPGGCRGYQGFGSLGHCAYFWTASPAGGDNGWRRGLCGDDNGSAREEDRRYFGLSVRCVKNQH